LDKIIFRDPVASAKKEIAKNHISKLETYLRENITSELGPEIFKKYIRVKKQYLENINKFVTFLHRLLN
jgi:hypothetical protein